MPDRREKGVYYMPSKSNVEMLEKVSHSLESSQGVFVVDYRGLSVKETQEVPGAEPTAGQWSPRRAE